MTDEQVKDVVAFGGLLFIAAGILCAGLLIGSGLGDPTYRNVSWSDLDDKSLDAAPLEEKIPRFDVLVRFVSPEELATECQSIDALGCSQAQVKPCTVWLPAGRTIIAYPNMEDAFLKRIDQDHDDLFFHEVLHCLHPNWHAPWTKLYNLLSR